MKITPRMQGSTWLPLALKGFGVLHLSFAILGLHSLIYTAIGLVNSGYFSRSLDPTAPFKTEVFLVRTAINLILLAGLAYAGVLILRGRSRGIYVSNVLFVSLIAYAFASLFLGGTDPVGLSIAATAGTGDVGTDLIVMTGYPFIALIGLNLIQQKLRREQGVENHSGDDKAS